jgi:hypothetical protein
VSQIKIANARCDLCESRAPIVRPEWSRISKKTSIAGECNKHLRRGGALRPRSRWLFCLAVAYLVLGLLVAAPWTKVPGLSGARLLPDFRPDLSKQYLSAWRLAGIVALAYVLASAVSPHSAWLRWPWAKLLINCGQNSLPIFCFSIVLSLLGFVILVQGGHSWLLELIVNVSAVALLCFAAWKLVGIKKQRKDKSRSGINALKRNA